ncbi:hypothetical protein CWN17_13345, partial [Klebsiella pneumoniae]
NILSLYKRRITYLTCTQALRCGLDINIVFTTRQKAQNDRSWHIADLQPSYLVFSVQVVDKERKNNGSY